MLDSVALLGGIRGRRGGPVVGSSTQGPASEMMLAQIAGVRHRTRARAPGFDCLRACAPGERSVHSGLEGGGVYTKTPQQDSGPEDQGGDDESSQYPAHRFPPGWIVPQIAAVGG